MPLVVPGLQSTDGKDDWMSKLMGKKLGDQHDEMVGFSLFSLLPVYPPFFFSLTDYSVLFLAKLIHFTTSTIDICKDGSSQGTPYR